MSIIVNVNTDNAIPVQTKLGTKYPKLATNNPDTSPEIITGSMMIASEITTAYTRFFESLKISATYENEQTEMKTPTAHSLKTISNHYVNDTLFCVNDYADHQGFDQVSEYSQDEEKPPAVRVCIAR